MIINSMADNEEINYGVTSPVAPNIVVDEKQIERYQQYFSFGLSNRHNIEAKRNVKKLTNIISTKIIDHSTTFKPMLIAVGNSIVKESNNNDQNVNIARPLKYNVMEMHIEKTKIENVYKELNISTLYYKEYKSHTLTVINTTKQLRNCLSLFEKSYLKTNRNIVAKHFTSNLREYLQGSGRELKAGLQLMFEAGNYPSIHDMNHLTHLTHQIDRLISLLKNEDESDQWPHIINALWTWSATHEMRKFLVQRGLLDSISPLSIEELVFRVATRDVVRLASGLLSAMTCESVHCAALLRKGAFLSCIELLEHPKARNMQTKKNLITVIYNCMFEAEQTNMIDFAIEKKAEFSIGRKNETATLINRLFVILQQVFDKDKLLANVSHTMLANIICMIGCYSEGFKLMLNIEKERTVDFLLKNINNFLLIEHAADKEPEESSSRTHSHATNVVYAFSKCLWAVCYHVHNITDLESVNELTAILLRLTRHKNQRISYCALASLSCTIHTQIRFDKDCVVSMNNILYHSNLMCKTFAVSILSNQMKLENDEDTIFQHTISHVIHIVCDQNIMELRIQCMRLVFEILLRKPGMVILDHDVRNLIWLLGRSGSNLTLKTLIILSLWAICRNVLPFTDQQKQNLIDILHHNVVQLKTLRQIDAVNHVAILLWLLSYDETVQKHMFLSQYIQTFTDIFKCMIKDDSRNPKELLLPQPVDHFPTASNDDEQENSHNIFYDIVMKILSVLNTYKEIGDQLMKEKFYDTLLRIITTQSVSSTLAIACTKMFQLLCSNPTHENTIKLYVGNEMVLATILTILIKRDNPQLKTFVASCVSSLFSDKERQFFVALGGGKSLIQLINKQVSKNPASLDGIFIRALYNLSVCKRNRCHLCKIGLSPLLRVARNRIIPKDTRNCAGKTLQNLKLHPGNLSAFYKIELQMKTDEAFGKIKYQPPLSHRSKITSHNMRRPKTAETTYRRHQGGRQVNKTFDNDSMELKQSYLEWFDKLTRNMGNNNVSNNTNGFERLFASKRPQSAAAGFSYGQRDKTKQIRPPTRPRSPRNRPSTAGSFGGRRIQPGKAKHELNNRMRQPISRIWKTSPLRSKKRQIKSMNENPWEPDVHHYEPLEAPENTRSFNSTSPVKVILSPPHSPRSHVRFGSNIQSRDKQQSSQMVMWKYVEGNRISKALNLKVYEQPDGTKVHYFFKQNAAEPKSINKVTVPSRPTEIAVFPIQPVPIQIEKEAPCVAWPPLDHILMEPDPPKSDTSMMSSYLTKISEAAVAFFGIHNNNGNNNDNTSSALLQPTEPSMKSPYEIAWENDWNHIMSRNLFSNFVKCHSGSNYFDVGDTIEVVDMKTKKARKADVRFITKDRVTVVYQRDRQKAVVHIDEVRHTRPPRGQEIVVNETLQIPLFQLQTMHGCNIKNMERVSNFSLGAIDTNSITRTTGINAASDINEVISIVVSGHNEHVKHAIFLLQQILLIGKIENMLEKHHGELTRIFNYFRCLGKSNNILINEVDFFLLASEIKLIEPISNICNRHHVREIYELVSSNGDKLHGRKNNSKKIQRYEFMEIILRCAYLKHGISRKVDIDTALEIFMGESIRKAFGSNFNDDGSKFRKDFFSHEHIEDICETNINFLAYVFISCTQKLNGEHTMSLHDFIHFLEAFKLFDANFTMRDARFLFMSSVEELNKNTILLDFIGFLEALFRMAGFKKIPSAHEMELIGVRNFDEYCAKKNAQSKISHLIQHQVQTRISWMISRQGEMNVDDSIPLIKRLFSLLKVRHGKGINLGTWHKRRATYDSNKDVQKIINHFARRGLNRKKWKKGNVGVKKRSKLKPQASFKRPPPQLKYTR